MSQLNAIAGLIEQSTDARADGVSETAIPRLSLYRWSNAAGPLHATYEPCVCLVAAGAKQAIAGTSIYAYGAGQYIVVTADVPVVGHITVADGDKPFLAVLLRFDAKTLGELMLEVQPHGVAREAPVRAIGVSVAEPSIIDAFLRMLTLLQTPEDIRVLGPLIEREILYRLLCGEQRQRVRQAAFADSRLHDVHRAISRIKRHFNEPLSIDALASAARMSESSLHQHFKAVTGMSPLQYQKRLRLHEARRLMLGEALDAAAASHSVGYESPSQFSREYRRLFGAPPAGDIADIRSRGGKDPGVGWQRSLVG